MDRGVTERTMGLSDDAIKINWRNPLFPNIWNRSSYPYGNQYVQHENLGLFSNGE